MSGDLSKRDILWIIIISSTLTVMAGAILGPVVTLIRDGLNLSPSSAGLVITVHSIFIAILSPVAGSIIDKIGAKKPYILGLILYGFSGGAGLVIDTYWLLLVSRAFLGVAVAFIFTSILVLIYNLYHDTERDKVMGLRASANSIGAVVWPLLGGALGAFSWHFPFGIYTIGIPLGILAYFSMPEIPRVEETKTDRGINVLNILWKKRLLFVIYGFMFLLNVFLYTNVVYLPQLLENFGITSSFHISLFLAVLGMSAATIASMYDKVKALLAYKKILLFSLALWTIAFLIIAQSPSELWIAPAIILYGIGHGMSFPTVMLWVGELVPATFQGRFSSYLGMIGFLGQFSAPIIFAPVASFMGIEWIFLVASVTSSVLFVLFLTVWWNQRF